MRLLEVKFNLLSVDLDFMTLEGHRYGVYLSILPIRGELNVRRLYNDVTEALCRDLLEVADNFIQPLAMIVHGFLQGPCQLWD